MLNIFDKSFIPYPCQTQSGKGKRIILTSTIGFLLFFISNNVFAITQKKVLQQMQSQDLLLYELIQQLYVLQFCFLAMIIIALALIGGQQR